MSLRRLPGVRRGFFEGSSLWAEDDHILAVTSQRFRERYRRFYYRDIHAIVVTKCARYVFSTRSAVIGLLLLIGCIFTSTRLASALLLAGCAIAWWLLSSYQSCLCRLHTAVSSETLPSAYRIWTATRLVAQLEPLIQAAQSELPPPAAGASVYASYPVTSVPAAPGLLAARRTAASFLLLLFLVLADAAATAYDLTLPAPRINWLMTLILVAQVASAVWMIVQYRTHALARSVLFWGLGFLLFVGGMMYAQTMINAFDQAQGGKQASSLVRNGPADVAFRKVYIGGCIGFALAGAFLIFRPPAGDER